MITKQKCILSHSCLLSFVRTNLRYLIMCERKQLGTKTTDETARRNENCCLKQHQFHLPDIYCLFAEVVVKNGHSKVNFHSAAGIYSTPWERGDKLLSIQLRNCFMNVVLHCSEKSYGMCLQEATAWCIVCFLMPHPASKFPLCDDQHFEQTKIWDLFCVGEKQCLICRHNCLFRMCFGIGFSKEVTLVIRSAFLLANIKKRFVRQK